MKKILLIVDMQYDFTKGKLGGDNTEAVIEPIVKYLQSHGSEYTDIYATQDLHDPMTYHNTREGKLFPEHCQDANGSKIIPKIAKFISKDHIITKSTFGITNFDLSTYINFCATDVVDIIGVCTSICVFSNAIILSNLLKNVTVRVLTNLCGDNNTEATKHAIYMLSYLGIEVI